MNFKRKSKCTVLAVMAFAFAVTGDYPVWAREIQINKELKNGMSLPVYYTVQKGDCLWSIAREFKVDVILLADANGRNLNSTLSENENLVELDIPRIRFRPVTGTISSRFG